MGKDLLTVIKLFMILLAVRGILYLLGFHTYIPIVDDLVVGIGRIFDMLAGCASKFVGGKVTL